MVPAHHGYPGLQPDLRCGASDKLLKPRCSCHWLPVIGKGFLIDAGEQQCNVDRNTLHIKNAPLLDAYFVIFSISNCGIFHVFIFSVSAT